MLLDVWLFDSTNNTDLLHSGMYSLVSYTQWMGVGESRHISL